MSELHQRITSASRFAQILALTFILVVFSYPMVVAGVVGPGNLGPSGEFRFGYTSLLFLGALLLLFLTRRLSVIPLQIVFTKSGKQKSSRRIIGAYLLSVLFGLVLREAVALIGMMLSILERNLFWCMALGLASFFSIARNWPKRHDLEVLLGNLKN